MKEKLLEDNKMKENKMKESTGDSEETGNTGNNKQNLLITKNGRTATPVISLNNESVTQNGGTANPGIK